MHSEAVTRLNWSEEGQRLMTASKDKSIKVQVEAKGGDNAAQGVGARAKPGARDLGSRGMV